MKRFRKKYVRFFYQKKFLNKKYLVLNKKAAFRQLNQGVFLKEMTVY